MHYAGLTATLQTGLTIFATSMRRRHMPNPSPMYAVVLSAGVLCFVALVGLFTRFLGPAQVLAIAGILSTSMVLLLVLATRENH